MGRHRPLTTGRDFHTATLLPNGKVLVVGWSASAELYDPVVGSWSFTGPLSTGRQNHTTTLLPNGKVLVVGGQDDDSILLSTELYDPTKGTVANLQGITVIGDAGRPIYTYNAIATTPHMLQLLLSE